MIDHVLGRPSTQFRKIQVLAVVAFWSLYLLKGNNHGPPGLRNLSTRLRNRLTPWQTMVVTLLWLYVARNFSKIMGFESPEPLANLYSRSYFRATWITTALDAGFWTAMKIKPQWLRDIASMAFSAYYLIAAEQADEKVRRVRATLTVEHLRVSWNKATTPYLSLLNGSVRPRFTKYAPRQIRIARPQESSYREPVNAWLYFDGSLAELREQSRLVLDVPGGGYVAMNPRTADDKLLAWAGRTGVPILSLDYRKAPEYPYPYALNECFDVYRSIVASRGRCVGLGGYRRPHIVISGDSAGGNLATGMTIMALQYGRTETRKWMGETPLPAPDGLVLIYPSLDMNIGSWMTEEQMSLIQDRGMRKTNENILRRKSEDYSRLTPKTSVSFLHDLSGQEEEQQAPATSSKDYFSSRPQSGKKTDKTTVTEKKSSIVSNQTPQIKTRIAVSSMISYFGDRILTPEMMRAMIILYIGPHNRPDFKTEYLLSPLLAPDAVLAVFPKTYFITGERDPLVDDTVIFAGRLRQAKLHRFRERQELALEKSKVEFNEKDHVEVNLIPGISHGFLNFPGIFPDGWKHIHKCAKWITDLLAMAEEREARASASSGLVASSSSLVASHMSQDAAAITGSQVETGEQQQQQVSRRASLAESSADDDHPLEMSLSRITPIKNGTTQRSTSAERGGGSHSNNNIKKGLSKYNPHNPSSTTSSSSADRPSQLKPAPFTLQLPPLKNAQNLSSSSSPSSSSAAAAAYHPQSAKTKTTKQASSNHVLSSSLQNSLNTERESDNENDNARSAASDNGKTFTRLPSEEDLIGRRMNGLAGGLMGLGEGVRTP